MPITICRANDVKNILEEQHIDAVLSIEHPNAIDNKGRAPRLHNIPQKILSFWDIEEKDFNRAEFQNIPSRQIVQAAFSFLNQYSLDDKVIIHCHAGKSRSVAIALSWVTSNIGINDAISYIKDIRPQSAPNMAVIKIVDDELSFDGEFLQAVNNDPVFTANREKTEQARQRQLKTFAPEKLDPK